MKLFYAWFGSKFSDNIWMEDLVKRGQIKVKYSLAQLTEFFLIFG